MKTHLQISIFFQYRRRWMQLSSCSLWWKMVWYYWNSPCILLFFYDLFVDHWLIWLLFVVCCCSWWATEDCIQGLVFAWSWFRSFVVNDLQSYFTKKHIYFFFFIISLWRKISPIVKLILIYGNSKLLRIFLGMVDCKG